MEDKSSSHWPITLTNGCAALFNLFLPLLLVRILSPEQIGRYKVFFLYAMLSPGLFLVSGFTNSLYHWVGKYPDTKPEVRESWTLLFAITATLTFLGLAFSHPLSSLFKAPILDLRLFFISTPFFLGSLFLEDLLIARGDIWKGSLYGSGFNMFRAANIFLVAWWTRSVELVFWVFVIGVVIRAVVGYLLLYKSGEISFIFSKKTALNTLRYALPVSVAGVAVLALQYVDQMTLSFRLSPEKFAFYSIGCLSIPPLQILETSVNRVMIPRLSRSFAAQSYFKAATLFSETVSELFRFLLPATVGLIIYSEPIIRVLFTDRYIAAAHFLRFYALVYLFSSLPYDAVARARGDSGWILRTSLFFGAFSVAATWFATGRWNAMGALIAVLASQLLVRLYSLAYNRKCFRVSYSSFLPFKDMSVHLGMALFSTLVSFALRPFFHDSRTWFFVTGPLFTLLYFSGVYVSYVRTQCRAPGPIRVLELSQTLCLGGLERTVFSLARTLKQKHPGFHVLVATYDHPEGEPSLGPQLLEEGIPLIQWQKRKGFSLLSAIRLTRLILAERTRILHVHDLGPLIYGSLAKLFCLGQIRLVLTVHTLLDIQQLPRHRFYYRIFLRFVDRIIAVSPGVQAGLLELNVRTERVEVIPNGAIFSPPSSRVNGSLEKWELKQQIQPGLSAKLYKAKWILCLARLHRGKGQPVVLDVWSALPASTRAELGLFFVGQETQPGYRDLLRKKISQMPDQDRIMIANPSERAHEWMASSDIFISGSLLEGMPLAPLEAVGSGLPTLLSDIEGHRFLQPWAYFFDLENPKQGAEKIGEILDVLKNEEGSNSFEVRWKATASLRDRWGAPTMTASYAETFESA